MDTTLYVQVQDNYGSFSINPQPVSVSGVSLDKTTLSLTPGATQRLIATISPSYATNKNIAWTSSNALIASVDNSGRITAHNIGANVTIRAATQDIGYTVDCVVNVTQNGGGIVNNSRGIINAHNSARYKGMHYADAAYAAAVETLDDLFKHIVAKNFALKK